MEIHRESEFVKTFAPLDFIGYIGIFYGYYRIIYDIMGSIKDLKCSPHWISYGYADASELSGQASFTYSFAVNLYLSLPFVADNARAALDNCHALLF